MQPCGTFHTSHRSSLSVVGTRLQWGLLVVGLVLAFLMPQLLSPSWLAWLSISCIILISVTGLSLLTGYCGQISLGQTGFMAVGAYATALLSCNLGFPFWVCIPLVMVISAVIGMVVGLPSLRIKGFYLALATIAFHFIVVYLIYHIPILGGASGHTVAIPSLFGLDIITGTTQYYFILACTIIAIFFAKNIARSKTGRAFVAIRDNDIAAEIMGINLVHYKLLAFTLSAVYGGLAGSLLGYYYTVVNPEMFPFMEAIWQLGMLIVGGTGSIMGAIYGVFLLRMAGELITRLSPAIGALFPAIAATAYAGSYPLIYGLIIVLFLLLEPRGVNHLWNKFKAFYRAWPFREIAS